MKKGQAEFSMKKLAEIIIGVIVLVVVFAVFVMLVNSFITQKTTPEIEDFERINSEFKTLLEASYPGIPISITVPVQRNSPLNMVVYSAETAPPECRKNTCICLHTKEDEKPMCHIYPDVRTNCAATCGKVCVTQSYPVVRSSPTSVTITRDCNEISIS